MSTPPVDIDSETIQFDGQWLGREELAQTIRALLDAGNYQVARPGMALEALNAALASVRTVTFRLPPELGDALALAAGRQNVSEGALIREALARFLGLAQDDAPVLEAPELVAEPAAAVALPEAAALPVPAPVPLAAEHSTPSSGPRPAFVPGPGALRAVGLAAPAPSVGVDPSVSRGGPALVTEPASPEDAAHAVELTPRPKTEGSEEPDAVERRWFGN